MRVRWAAVGGVASVMVLACGSRSTLDGAFVGDATGGMAHHAVGGTLGVGGAQAVGGSHSSGGVFGVGGAPSDGGAQGDGGALTAGGTMGAAGAGSEPTGGVNGSGGELVFGGSDGGGAAGAASNDASFAVHFGEQNIQVALAIAPTDAGAWVGGYVSKYGLESEDAFLAHVDDQGNVTRSLTFDGPKRQRINELARTGGGDLIVAGDFSGPMNVGAQTLASLDIYSNFVVRLDAEGAFESAFVFGDQGVYDLAFPENGELLVLSGSGSLVNGLPVDAATLASTSFLLTRFDDSMQPLGVRTYGTNKNEAARALTLAPNGTTWVAGVHAQATDLGCGVLPSGGGLNAFVLGLDAEGSCVRSTAFVSNSQVLIADIASDSAGNLVVSGMFRGSFDFSPPGGSAVPLDAGGGYFVVGLTPSLELRFLHTFHNLPWAVGPVWLGGKFTPRLAVDEDDHVLVAGYFADTLTLGDVSLTSAGSVDVFVLKLAADGSPIWGKRFGDEKPQMAFAVGAGITLDYVAGGFQGQLAGAPVPFTSNGLEDGFVLGLEP
jgi:hypothetical protein